MEEGGGTVFPHAGDPALNPGVDLSLDPYLLEDEVLDYGDCTRGFVGKPRRGDALLWYTIKVEGNGHEAVPDRYAMHAGCPPINGEKWGMNKVRPLEEEEKEM